LFKTTKAEAKPGHDISNKLQHYVPHLQGPEDLSFLLESLVLNIDKTGWNFLSMVWGSCCVQEREKRTRNVGTLQYYCSHRLNPLMAINNILD
jgi:hypothetical protein